MRNGFALLLAAGISLAVQPLFLSHGHLRGLAVVGAYTSRCSGSASCSARVGAISLGQGAFMALGGYTTAILCVDHGLGQIATIPIAAGVAGAAGVAAGLLSLRLGALSTGVITLGAALVVPTLALRFDGFSGGGAGLTLPAGSFAARQAYARDLGLSPGCCSWSAWWLARSRFGRALRAVRDNPVAAAAGGLNRGAYVVASFGLSGVYAGVAGALLAINLGHVDPGTFPLRLSLLLAAGAAVGGLGSVWGAPVAALLVGYLTDLTGLLPHVGKHRPGPTTFLFGAAIIVLVVGRGLGDRRRRSRPRTDGPRGDAGSRSAPRCAWRSVSLTFPAGSSGAAAGKIAIGSTGPFTGRRAGADVLRGEQAYFRFVNARGGVNGRQIEFELIDDGGDASRAAANARRLIERDSVFALFSVVGSEASLVGARRGGRRPRAGGVLGRDGPLARCRLPRDRLPAVGVRGRGDLRGSTCSRPTGRTPRWGCSTRTTSTGRTRSPACGRVSASTGARLLAASEAGRPDGDRRHRGPARGCRRAGRTRWRCSSPAGSCSPRIRSWPRSAGSRRSTSAPTRRARRSRS